VDSLDRPVTPDGTPLADLVTDPAAPDPEQQTLEYEQSRLVDDAIDLLPPRERLVIKRHFGLEGIPESIRDLALDLHLSPQRTRALERDALHRLAGTLDPERKRV
jgi:DNA-directed RNA polymerase sigma subunit (sigma70/sigma32)